MDNQWYYARNGADRQGPVTESELRSLLAQGRLQADDLVWREGLSAWTPLRDLPDFQAAAPVPAVPGAGTGVPIPAGLCGWMAFNGIVIILSGLTYVMSCFALPSGILLLIAGASLMSAQSLLAGLRTVDPALLPFLQKLRGFFLMTGVATLVAIVFTALFLIIVVGLGAASIASIMEQFTPH
jgi:hypothetical protein